MLSSEALDFEVSRIPDETRRNEVLAILAMASEHLILNDGVEALAQSFQQSELSAMDAIHLALASTAKVDYFCTCDEKLFLKATSLSGLSCKVITLLGLVPKAIQ